MTLEQNNINHPPSKSTQHPAPCQQIGCEGRAPGGCPTRPYLKIIIPTKKHLKEMLLGQNTPQKKGRGKICFFQLSTHFAGCHIRVSRSLHPCLGHMKRMVPRFGRLDAALGQKIAFFCDISNYSQFSTWKFDKHLHAIPLKV